MRHGLSVSNFGSYSEPQRFLDLVRAAEDAEWDGVFVWDHLAFVWGPPSADPWVLLAAAAAVTDRIRLGTGVTPVARRRPHVLANQVATLDRLSGGRVIFGAGLGGGHGEFSRLGDDEDEHVRAQRLDEALGLLRRWWDGERVTHRGEHFIVDGVALEPTPAGHLPIWIGGNAPRALRRAARHDGWAPNTSSPEGMTMSADELASRLREIDTRDGFDVAVHGYGDRVDVAAYERAGATWWLETIHDRRGSYDELLSLVRRGAAR